MRQDNKAFDLPCSSNDRVQCQSSFSSVITVISTVAIDKLGQHVSLASWLHSASSLANEVGEDVGFTKSFVIKFPVKVLSAFVRTTGIWLIIYLPQITYHVRFVTQSKGQTFWKKQISKGCNIFECHTFVWKSAMNKNFIQRQKFQKWNIFLFSLHCNTFSSGRGMNPRKGREYPD